MEHQHGGQDAESSHTSRPRPRPRSRDLPALPAQAIVQECSAPSSVACTASGSYPTSPPPSSSSSQSPAFFAGQTSASIGGGQFINQQGAQVTTNYFVYNINNSNQPPPIADNQGGFQKHCTYGPSTGSGRTRRITCASDSNVEYQPQTESPTEIEYPNETPSHVAGEDSSRCIRIPSVTHSGLVTEAKLLHTQVSSSSYNGSATSHVKRTPGTKDLKHLIELACGLERLHNQGFVCGDLQGDNAMPSSNSSHSGSLSDLGKSKASLQSDGPRWLAPEVVVDKMMSKQSDVWTFGMVCLEFLSANRPFAELKNDLDVIRELLRGGIPERPGKAAVEQGLCDAMWELLCRCWQKQPESRPPITEVKNTLLTLQGHPPAAWSVHSTRSKPTEHTNEELQPRKPPNHPATSPLMKPLPRRPDTHPSISSGTGVKPPTPTSGFDGDESSVPTSDQSSAITQTTDHNSNSSSSNTSFHSSSVGHSSHKVQPSPLHHSQLPPLDLDVLPRTSPSEPARSRVPPAHDRVTSRENDHSSLIPDVFPTNSGDHPPPGSDEAVTTLATIVALDTSGIVLGGTLEGLLYRLITSSNSTDVEYRNILLMACAELTSPNHLFSILSRRFYDAKGDSRRHPQERVTIQLNILMVMKHWLSVRYLAGENRLLIQVGDFCQLATQMTASETMKRKVAELIEVIHCMAKENISPHHPGRKMLQGSQMRPHDLAIALTLLEGDKYAALTPADYILHLKRHPGQFVPHLRGTPAADRVEDACITNNLITRWTQDSILYPDTIKDRAETLKFFINTAEECRKLRNFSSSVAIASALHSPPIARLKLTKAELILPMQGQLESLRDILKPSSSHRCYRRLLKQASNAEERDRCVPWLSVHLEDLRLPLQKHPTLREVDGRMLIDFRRYVKFMARIKEVLHYHAPDLESFREQGQLAYLEHHLRNTEASARSPDDFMKRSEDQEPYNRAQEGLAKMRRLGFRTSQSSLT